MMKLKIGLFSFVIFFCYAIFAFSQPLYQPLVWEVKEVDNGFIKIVGNNNKHLLIDSQTQIVKQEIKTIQDIDFDKYVTVFGRQSGDQAFKAIRIILLADTEYRSPLKKKGLGPQQIVSGKIVSKNPLTVQTQDKSTITLQIMPWTKVIADVSISISDVSKGNKLLLAPGKIIILPEAFSSSPGSFREKRSVAMTQKTSMNAPMPPSIQPIAFDKKLMRQRDETKFGFKDANILKPDIFSWYDEYGQTMNDLGSYWVEFSGLWGFHWNLIQPIDKEGVYTAHNWERFDQMVRNAQAQNLQIIAKINASIPVSNIFGKKRKKIIPSLPKDIEGYTSFVRDVVERYDGDGKNDMPGLLYPIKNWEIEDEPVYPMFFSGTGTDYARLLKHAYKAVKLSDPGANVICAMIYSEFGPLGDRDPKQFLSQFYDELKNSGSHRAYDIIDYHCICIDASVSVKDRYLRLKRELKYIKKMAKQAGMEPVPFQSFEMAVPFLDEKTQAQDLIKEHIFAFSQGIGKVLWSGIKASSKKIKRGINKTKEDPFERNAIITADNTHKLAYYSYKKMVEILGGFSPEKIEIITDKNDRYLYRFKKNDQYIWVAWSEDKEDSKMVINIPKPFSKVRVTDSVPTPETGEKDIVDAHPFNTQEIKIKNKTITITVNQTPVYIETHME